MKLTTIIEKVSEAFFKEFLKDKEGYVAGLAGVFLAYNAMEYMSQNKIEVTDVFGIVALLLTVLLLFKHQEKKVKEDIEKIINQKIKSLSDNTAVDEKEEKKE